MAASAAVSQTCRVVGSMTPVPSSIRVVRAPIPDRITSAFLMSIRSESQTRRKPSRSASTPSSIPWAGVRETVSHCELSCSEVTAPAMT